MLSSLISIAILVEILTLNHFPNWLGSLIGTGSAQSWYYNSEKTYYIWDIDIAYLQLFQAALVLLYLYKLYKNRASGSAIKRYGCLAFLNMTCFCAANEYRILSGTVFRDVELLVLFATLVFEALNLARQCIDATSPKAHSVKSKVLLISTLFCVVFLVSTVKEQVVTALTTSKDGIYIEELGGNVTDLGEDLLAAENFLGDETFFSTYSSAQEVISGIYQPSGIDYIIHALGDTQREKYLESFETGDFTYTATIQESFTPWEMWIQRANWFFYRELYEDWHPVFENSYLKFWARNEGQESHVAQDNISVEIQKLSDDSQKIIIHTDDDVNGIADVFVDYQVLKDGSLSSHFLLRTMLYVSDSLKEGDYNYLPGQSTEYIPVHIENGYGEVILTSMPQKDTLLEINEASCNRIFTVLSDTVAEAGAGEGSVKSTD